MKSKFILMVAILLNAFITFAQNAYLNKLEITNVKTTSIVFPDKIQSIDIGSRDILARRVEGTENVLQLKAANPAFPETNVTVITESGTLHQFDVRFCSSPASCYFIVSDNGRTQRIESVIFDNKEPVSFYRRACQAINAHHEPRRTYKVEANAIELILNAIYIQKNKIFLPLVMINNSFVPYDIQSVRFFIRDRKQAKRTAIQEIEVKPVHVEDEPVQIRENASVNSIWVFEKFTIPKSKELVIELIERNGSRNINLKLRSRALEKVIPVKE